MRLARQPARSSKNRDVLIWELGDGVVSRRVIHAARGMSRVQRAALKASFESLHGRGLQPTLAAHRHDAQLAIKTSISVCKPHISLNYLRLLSPMHPK